MKPALPAKLLHMASIAKRAGLDNLAQTLVEASGEAKSMMWELKVLKKKKIRRSDGKADK